MATILDPNNTLDPRCVGYAAGLNHESGTIPRPRLLAAARYSEICDRAEFVSGYWLGKDARG